MAMTTHAFRRALQLALVGAAVSLTVSTASAVPPAKAAALATKPAEATKSRAEVDKLIDEMGKTQPDWWDDTQLNYPGTLDLTWAPGKGKWENKRVMGAYYWDIIDPNPARWREGVKLANYCLTNTLKGNPKGQTSAMGTMARIYTEMLGDFPRGAYWAKKNGNMPLTLVECYMKLDCPAAAKEILKGMGVDQTRNGQAIKLWAELGDLKTALSMAEARARLGDPTAAFLAAGDACRRAEKFPEAVAYYQKVIAAKGNNRDDPVNKKRAQASLDAIKLFDSLDLTKIADGAYKGQSLGYVGPVEIEVTVAANKIEEVEVTQHHEKQFYSSINDVPSLIVAKQSVKGVDTTTGATRTSEAIINATAKALSAAQK
ncbi:hypothetical protein BH10PLA1_BH10PLA1_05820 [soil metagenome]